MSKYLLPNNALKKCPTGIGTQGVRKDSWVTLYTFEFSEEGEEFIPYKENGVTKVTYKILLRLYMSVYGANAD